MGLSATLEARFGFTDTTKDAHISAKLMKKLSSGEYSASSKGRIGESLYAFVYRSPNVAVAQVHTSFGTAAKVGEKTIEMRDAIVFNKLESDIDPDKEFINDDKVNKPVHGNTYSLELLYGSNLDGIKLESDGLTFSTSQAGLASYAVTYSTTVDIYEIQSPPKPNDLDGKEAVNHVIFIGAVTDT